MKQILNLIFASSLSGTKELNSSFDTGVLRIAYHGENRNKSYISKETFERCIKSMYNCPIVCHYDRESDSLGGHDIDLVTDKDGNLRLVNLTTPVGCIPESSKYWWEEVEEEDGTIHEYLYATCLLWKRQEAYKKIKEDGVASHSMEISVNDGEMIDGIFHINDFEFTAFALIGVEPCFEKSSIKMFSAEDFKEQMALMMQDLKETFSMVDTSLNLKGVEDIHPHETCKEGGEKVLEEKMNLVTKYGIDIDALDFSIEDYTPEELEERFAAMTEAVEVDSIEEAQDIEVEEGTDTSEETDSTDEEFALNSNITQEIFRIIGEQTIQTEWGLRPVYYPVDYDNEKSEVYAWDTRDWLLYGFSFSIKGDSVEIDYESKKRVKYAIVDFDEGEQPSPFASVFDAMESAISKNAEVAQKYQDACDTIESMTSELVALREYKNDVELSIAKEQREAVFSAFEDLSGIEAFEDLRNRSMEYDVETLEEKCFAIRGRNNTTAKFNFEKKPKLFVAGKDSNSEPYGGIFAKYGIEANN